MALIKCENVSIGYEGQTVVKDLNFQIGAGDYLCIVGEKEHACQEPSRPEIRGERQDRVRGRAEAERDRIPPSAD